MSEHDLEKLLGGFAADTLTPEEKQQLYSAAVQDQSLFNSLADEQALKELLADPVVRRRLLQSVQEAGSTTDRGPASWLNWFRRPAGLAWAGGFAAAVFAVVLGINVYQESLREAGRSVAVEEESARTAPIPAPSEPQPASPPIGEPLLRAQANTKLTGTPRKEAHVAKKTKQETEMTAKSNEEQAATYPEPDVLRGRAQSTPRTFAQSKEDAPDSADQERAREPSTSALVPAPANTPATAAPTGQDGLALSARSLFYGDTAEFTSELMTGERERSHSAQQLERLEQKKLLSHASQTGNLAGATKPLGIRYSLATYGMEGPHDDRDTRAPTQADSTDLMIEANQDGFFQVWGEDGAQQPHLLFPLTEQDPVASRLIAYQLRRIPILAVYRTITIRFSRRPFGTLSSEDLVEMNRTPLGQLQESSTSMRASGSRELAIYVVNQDPSVGMLLVRIPIHQP
jgi:hypothetical protein